MLSSMLLSHQHGEWLLNIIVYLDITCILQSVNVASIAIVHVSLIHHSISCSTCGFYCRYIGIYINCHCVTKAHTESTIVSHVQIICLTAASNSSTYVFEIIYICNYYPLHKVAQLSICILLL